MRWFWQPIPDEDLPTYMGAFLSPFRTTTITSMEEERQVLDSLAQDLREAREHRAAQKASTE